MAQWIILEKYSTLCRNASFIVANDEIKASELETYMVEKIQKKVYPKFTRFILVSGMHHGIDLF